MSRANTSTLSRFEAVRVTDEMLDDFVSRHESMGISALIATARELHAPVRRDETEAVPKTTPRLAHAAPLEDDVLHVRARELVAQR
jgi:hypothetical protein